MYRGDCFIVAYLESIMLYKGTLSQLVTHYDIPFVYADHINCQYK